MLLYMCHGWTRRFDLWDSIRRHIPQVCCVLIYFACANTSLLSRAILHEDYTRLERFK